MTVLELNVKLVQDSDYQKEGAFILNCQRNNIKMWTLAIDVRSSERPTVELPERGLLKGDKVLFHYTSKQALEMSFPWFSCYFRFVLAP